ncbi:restriction endonuclease subunit S [Cellvibrio sp. PSBB023]|uniref:restriction endonuclease subunit S n=1 Tax=Cellvibrio sp. PSBB023 TaxID=1945512 RepID=UPI0009C27AD4|nr:restriction endonuclease subunit S [Cellvibrio sp. PSBB023]AQT59171.1 hypothetical protein B0D95_03025 [Cellvibrio sp. PSBB023]
MSWPLVKLGDIFDITSSKRVHEKDWRSEGVPFYRAREVAVLSREGIVDNELFIDESMYEEFKHKYGIPKEGDLLVTAVGTLGKIYAVKAHDRFYFKDASVIWLRKKSEVDTSYVWHALNSVEVQRFIQNSSGATVGAYTISRANETEIPLPPLEEQKRIAAILDKADAIRRKRQQAIKLADDFLRSVFLEMFGDPVSNSKGWNEYVLTDVADIRSGVTKGKIIDLNRSVTLPYLRVANVQDGYLDLSEIKNIVVSENDAKKCILKKGDILLTEGGDPDKLGRGYVWNDEIERCIHQNHIFSVRIKVSNKKIVYPEFLSALISSQRGKRYFLKVGKQTTGIATINKTVLGEFRIFIPPMELQDKYIRVKNAIKHQSELFSKGDLNLFASLSQRCFSGDI